MQKYWLYIKSSNSATEHQTAKLKSANINVAQTNAMAIHATNLPIFDPTQSSERIAKLSAH